MNAHESGGSPGAWLARTIRNLLEEKYGRGRIPGVRGISADISRANGGETLSHGHVHNIVSGEAENLTDRTRALLANFFDKPPSYFYPSVKKFGSEPGSVRALAARFATLDPAQIDAIKQAIEIVTDTSDHPKP